MSAILKIIPTGHQLHVLAADESGDAVRRACLHAARVELACQGVTPDAACEAAFLATRRQPYVERAFSAYRSAVMSANAMLRAIRPDVWARGGRATLDLDPAGSIA